MSSATTRFVSLHGFYAFKHPVHWKQEPDEAGHYLFYNENGGSGVLRVMLLPNDFENDNDGRKMLNEIVQQNKAFNPVLNAVGQLLFVSFVKQHDVNGQLFTVYYWATVREHSVVLFAYTIQSAMRDMPTPQNEIHVIETMLSTFEWLHDTATHN